MRRLPVIFGMVTLALAFLVSGSASPDTKKETKKAKGMLPQGFKDLGLSKAQIEKIYMIQAEFKAKIAELDKKAKELKTQEFQESLKVLSDDQREKYLKSKGADTKKEEKKKDDKK